MKTTTHHADTELLSLLNRSQADDLSLLGDYLTDNGAGRLSLAGDICQLLNDAKKTSSFPPPINRVMVNEIQRFGGNSLANLFRGSSGVSYRTVVQDVATHLKVKVSGHDSVEAIENAILAGLTEKAWEHLSEDERKDLLKTLHQPPAVGPLALAGLLGAVRLGGPATYAASALIANSVAQTVAGRGLVAMGGGLLGGRALAALAGPIGWVLTAVWTLYDLASPAYRVTVPFVVQVAYMRRKG